MTKLFVYGTLRQGQSNHDLLIGRYLSRTPDVVLNGYRLEEIDGLYYAVADPRRRIVGELYHFKDESILAHLDAFEGFNQPELDVNLYERILHGDIHLYIRGNYFDGPE